MTHCRHRVRTRSSDIAYVRRASWYIVICNKKKSMIGIRRPSSFVRIGSTYSSYWSSLLIRGTVFTFSLSSWRVHLCPVHGYCVNYAFFFLYKYITQEDLSMSKIYVECNLRIKLKFHWSSFVGWFFHMRFGIFVCSLGDFIVSGT